jgi:hypothetical protein
MYNQSCGYAVPLFDFKMHRTGLNNFALKLAMEDIKAESESTASPSSNTSAVSTIFTSETDIPSQVQTYPLTAKGLKGYWRDRNCQSIDGLPGVTSGFKAPQSFSPNASTAGAEVRPERFEPVSFIQVLRGLKGAPSGLLLPRWELQEKHGVVVGFVLGALTMVVAERGMSVLAGIQWS